MNDCIDYNCDGAWHTCLFCDGSGYTDTARGHQIECVYCEGEGGFECPAERMTA